MQQACALAHLRGQPRGQSQAKDGARNQEFPLHHLLDYRAQHALSCTPPQHSSRGHNIRGTAGRVQEDPLPGPLANTNPGKKGGRKDEQYRLMFSELERAVQAQSSTSARHHTVLECLMEVRNKPMPIKREADGEMGLAARELERYQTMTERERSDFNQVKQEERSMMEQSGSPAPKKARPMSLGGASMLDIWRSRIEREAAKKHREFAGRRNLGEVVKLYTKMEREVKEEVKV